MNPKIISISLIPFLIALCVWGKDGARIGLWLTSVEDKKEIPIVDGMPELGTQTQIIWKEQFVSGIETPIFGLVGSLGVFTVFYLRKFKKSK